MQVCLLSWLSCLSRLFRLSHPYCLSCLYSTLFPSALLKGHSFIPLFPYHPSHVQPLATLVTHTHTHALGLTSQGPHHPRVTGETESISEHTTSMQEQSMSQAFKSMSQTCKSIDTASQFSVALMSWCLCNTLVTPLQHSSNTPARRTWNKSRACRGSSDRG
jgi:hypothetical protein